MMQSIAKTPEEYINEIPEDRIPAFVKLRETILANIPAGFEEGMGYGMIGYAVPHSLYPAGYHCTPELPLPFVGIASQKHFIALYHMGIYGDSNLHKWFVSEYPKHCKTKLDMGKSCIRFKKPNEIPYELIAELMKKVTVQAWITMYELTLKKGKG